MESISYSASPAPSRKARMQQVNVHTPKGWMNDPNGFIYYKGEYHLFYQHFPYAPTWGTICWGHMTSKDLVSWEQHDVALFPTKPEDQNGCFSGSAVEKNGELHLFYTGVHYDQADPDNINKAIEGQLTSAQLHVVSPDGYTFDNFTKKSVIIPAITDPTVGDRTHTRDPKVWRGEDAWYLVLGSNIDRKQGEVLFYRSEDLDHWELVNRSLLDPSYGWMCECPDVFEVDGRDVFISSAMHKEAGMIDTSVWTMADFDPKTCDFKTTTAPEPIDYGHDFYAPQTTMDAEGRRVMIGWMRMPEPVDGEWIGMFCAPRVVKVVDGRVHFSLHPAIREAIAAGKVGVPGSNRARLVKTMMHDGEYINVGGFIVWQEGGHIYTDRSIVYRPNESHPYLQSATPEAGAENEIEILAGDHIVEVYVNDGQYVISNVVYGLDHTLSTNSADIAILGF